jgi:hypothetical protein
MKVACCSTNTSASAFVAKGPAPLIWMVVCPLQVRAVGSSGTLTLITEASPPVHTLYNPWTGAIQMWPMPQPTGHGILRPRLGPCTHAYMASRHAGHVAPYGAALYSADGAVLIM